MYQTTSLTSGLQMNKCSCGSYAINRHNQTPDSELDECDVCFWKHKYEEAQKDLLSEKQWYKMSEKPPIMKGPRIILYNDSFGRMRVGVADWIGTRWALPDYELEHILYWKRIPSYPNDRVDKTSV